METEATKEPVDIQSAISFWNKQNSDISKTSEKPFKAIQGDAQSPTPSPVGPKPKRKASPLGNASSQVHPPPVAPKPKATRKNASSQSKESLSDTQGRKAASESEESLSDNQVRKATSESKESLSDNQGRKAASESKESLSDNQVRKATSESKESLSDAQGRKAASESKESLSDNQVRKGTSQSKESPSDNQGRNAASDSKESLSDTQGRNKVSESKESISDNQGRKTASDSKESLSDTQGRNAKSESKGSLSDTQGRKAKSESKESLSDTQGRKATSESKESLSDTQGRNAASESKESLSDTHGRNATSESKESLSDTQGRNAASESKEYLSDTQGRNAVSESKESLSDTQGRRNVASESKESFSDIQGKKENHQEEESSKEPLIANEIPASLPRKDETLQDSPRRCGILKYSPRISGIDGSSKDHNRAHDGPPDNNVAAESPQVESLEFKSEEIIHPTKTGTEKKIEDVKPSARDGLATLDFSTDEPGPDLDLSPNINDYEERLKESFRKARLKKASPKLKRKYRQGTDLTQLPLSAHQGSNEPRGLLGVQKLWESCLKDERGKVERQYGMKYLERDSAKQLLSQIKPVGNKFEWENLTERDAGSISQDKPEVAEKFKQSNSTERIVHGSIRQGESEVAERFKQSNSTERGVLGSFRRGEPKVAERFQGKILTEGGPLSKRQSKPDVREWWESSTQKAESISTRVSYFDSKTRNGVLSNCGPIPSERFVSNRLEYGSTVSGEMYFQSKRSVFDDIQSTSSRCDESKTSLKLATGHENRFIVQPKKRHSTFQPIPIRFSTTTSPQPKRLNFVDALSVPAEDEASASSSEDSNNLPSTSSSDQQSVPSEVGDQGTSFGYGDEDTSSISGDSSTENVDEEEAEDEFLAAAAGTERTKGTISRASWLQLISQRRRRKSQLSNSHRKFSQSPNGGHRQLKKAKSLENLYQLYHHLVVSVQNRPDEGDGAEGVRGRHRSAGDNVSIEPEETESEEEIEDQQDEHGRWSVARLFCMRKNIILDLFVVMCCILGSYSILMAYMMDAEPRKDYSFGYNHDYYWK